MIEQDQDFLGALDLLHPELAKHISAQFKKVQRRCETLELRQSVQGGGKGDGDPELQARVKQLEKVNKEL